MIFTNKPALDSVSNTTLNVIFHFVGESQCVLKHIILLYENRDCFYSTFQPTVTERFIIDEAFGLSDVTY